MALPLLLDRTLGDTIDRPIQAADLAFASGSVTSGSLAANVVFSGNIGSGQIGQQHLSFNIPDEAFIMAMTAV